MDIKELALKVAKEMNWRMDEMTLETFATRLIAALEQRVAELENVISEHGADMWAQGEEYAVLSAKCAQAQIKADALEQQVAALTEKIVTLESDNEQLTKERDDAVTKHKKISDWLTTDSRTHYEQFTELQKENESLRYAFHHDTALSEALKELDAYKQIAVDAATECNALRADRDSQQRVCMAAQAREAKLREGFEEVFRIAKMNQSTWGGWMRDHAEKMISLPADDSALQARLKEERDR